MNKEHSLTVETIFMDNRQSLELKLLNTKKGYKKPIKDHDLNRPGLLLSGFTDVFSNEKIQVFGYTEIGYLKTLAKKKRAEAFKRLLDLDIPCLIVANDSPIERELLNIANEANTSVFRSPHRTIQIYHVLLDFLNTKAAPRINVHGTLVDVYGIGVLFTGRSGIGKSEIALDLIERGHRLVADDVVEIFRKREGVLIGTSQELLKNMIEIRGVGLIDIWSLFGIRAIRIQKRVEVEVKLEDHQDITEYDRLGNKKEFTSYLDVEIPLIRLPIFPGKNITVISEVISLKLMQRIYGFRPEKEFMKKLNQKIKRNDKIRQYLADDIE
ncbi:MAG: HPr(Ser) kinase/phosphatase [bacterium]|nr:HPr(Ser) kinase/phosphatase [bacterium]